MTVVTAHPLTTMAFIFSLLAGIFWAYGQYGRGMVFFNDADPQFLTLSVAGRGNFDTEEINALVYEVEQRVLETDGIRTVNARTTLPGAGGGNGSTSDMIGSMFIELTPESQREETGLEMIEILRQRTTGFPGLRIEIQKLEQGPPVGKPIQIELRSRYRELLEPAMIRITQYMESQPEYIDDRALPSIEWQQSDRAQALCMAPMSYRQCAHHSPDNRRELQSIT